MPVPWGIGYDRGPWTDFVQAHSKEHWMPQELWKTAPVGVGILIIALVAGCPSGCSDAGSTATVNSGGGTEPPKSADKHVPTTKPMLDGWKKPAFAIILSGEQHGYMEPCGCSITQSGGLSRRADCFRQIAKEKDWPVTALDLGGLVKKDNEQNKLKFQVMLTALNELGYKAMALGTEELQLEHLTPGFLLTQAAPLNDGKSLSLVSANVELTLFKDPGSAPAAPTRIVTIAGHTFGVTAIIGKHVKSALFGNNVDPQITIKDAESVLPAAIAR